MSVVRVQQGRADAAVLLCCEHASNRIPAPWKLPKEDEWILRTHWAYDPGAADVVTDLAEALHATAVLSDFSRLLADPNRPPDSPEVFRSVAEGKTLRVNASLDDAERAKRLEGLYEPYHKALERAVASGRAGLCFSVHTFTPLYEGKKRSLEVGILFDKDEAEAKVLASALEAAGFDVALNEPYSGKEGLIYSVESHAVPHGRRCLEIEVRNDLAQSQAVRDRIVDCVAATLPGLANEVR